MGSDRVSFVDFTGRSLAALRSRNIVKHLMNSFEVSSFVHLPFAFIAFVIAPCLRRVANASLAAVALEPRLLHEWCEALCAKSQKSKSRAPKVTSNIKAFF